MPSLIRLIIFLLFLVGIGYGAMFALVAFVEPTQKEVTVRIPTRDLLGEPTRIPVGGEEAPATETGASDAPAANAEPEPGADVPVDQPE
jgi:hypothetical protein